MSLEVASCCRCIRHKRCRHSSCNFLLEQSNLIWDKIFLPAVVFSSGNVELFAAELAGNRLRVFGPGTLGVHLLLHGVHLVVITIRSRFFQQKRPLKICKAFLSTFSFIEYTCKHYTISRSLATFQRWIFAPKILQMSVFSDALASLALIIATQCTVDKIENYAKLSKFSMANSG